MFTTQQYQKARLARDQRFDGQFFVAVKTTGIFCRPICPATPPREHNVEYYTMAMQAMQAGFRPCLRCRPDSAPHSWAWQGVDTTVQRAIRLITEHPGLDMTALSSKLGISERYLRKLFQNKIGIGPKQFQLYQQLLFAKQLLHQTSLSITDVALASGFNSPRTLQQNMQRNLALTPGQVRRSGSSSPGGLTLKLSFRPPYNWDLTRNFLARRCIAGMETVTDNSYSRTFEYPGSRGYFRARYCPDQYCFNVELQTNELKNLRFIIRNIRRILDLDALPDAITQSLKDTGLDSRLINPGLRLPGIWSSFEAGCRAIIGQQVSVTAAIRQTTTLVQQLGERENHQIYFPSPIAVAEANLEFLGMPAARKQTLKNLAALFVENPDNTPQEWNSIKGIGPWTINYARMRGLSEPNIWLATDLIIKKQLNSLNINPELATPWRSYLTIQLWQSGTML